MDGAKRSGTPFISFFTPAEMLALAREASFTDVRHVPGTTLNERYFAGTGGWPAHVDRGGLPGRHDLTVMVRGGRRHGPVLDS